MESLITEAGPRNPLLFLSLSIVNRIPGYNPDEKEILNQLECLKDLINSVSASIFRIETVKNPVAVAVDALMSVSAVEAKKSISVRVSALECLKLLIEKLTECGINCFYDILPGILSKMIKICTGRVDVEVDKIIETCLKIIYAVIETFWSEQADWIAPDNLNAENFILLKQKYRENLDLVCCSLRPLIKCNQRIEMFRNILISIFKSHSKSCIKPSLSFCKLYLILSSQHNNGNVIEIPSHFTVQIYNTEIVEWFEINSENLREIHEEILIEKFEIIFGLINAGNLIPMDLLLILKKLTKLCVSIGDTVSIEFSDSSEFGIQTALKTGASREDFDFKVKIKFKNLLNFSKEFSYLITKLFEKLIEIDGKVVENFLLTFEDDSIENIIQKIDLASEFYKKSTLNSYELFRNCLKYNFVTFEVEKAQLIHLASLKLIWSVARKGNFNDYRGELMLILSGMTSDWLILKETSTQILKAISNLEEKPGICDLIKEQERFILDRLGIQLALPAMYPETPQIISILVRDIVDPSMALKFTDLLVKKVSENLALFQKHSAYCKDLLSVAKETIVTVSKAQVVKFIDPKDFAFIQREEQEESEDSEENNHKTSSSCQERIILDFLKIGINFILSDSKQIRSKSIDLVSVSVINYIKVTSSQSEPSELCQLIHLAWPNMIAALKDSISKDSQERLDILVIESFSNCCQNLFEKLPIFMRDRFIKDFWRLTIKKIKSKSSNSLLLNCLNCGILNCKPSTEICLEIVNHFKKEKVDPIRKLFESISVIEPDVIWYFEWIESGKLKEIVSPFKELKSFKLN